ncbi:DUF6882 domain-containing protein [Pedobacter mendelii]|uniref:Uncharacterized protein n=1 Tax=Pedobacter mendelii TaxID=1908240 RepID=A0ABQ2BE98_9SPHI|nr:DUF6882 domain-containing protein [Pedobacter mendelii]GGI23950.1 hypothetical protein GCM10008119_10220 [Pedobacter mendelii]
MNQNNLSGVYVTEDNIRLGYDAFVTQLMPGKMNFLRKFFARSARERNPGKMVSMKYPHFNKPEQQLIERFGGIAFDKQIDVAQIIGENRWSLDMINCEINFGDDLVFPFQILGSFSRSSQSWLWAWANIEADMANDSLQHAFKLKKYGDDNGIEFLKAGNFKASNMDLHLIGLTASGMMNASGYYIADYGKGAIVFTFKSDVIDKAAKNQHERIFTVFNQLISDFDVDHKAALKFYLEAKGYKTSVEKYKIKGLMGSNKIIGEFDKDNTLTKLSG